MVVDVLIYIEGGKDIECITKVDLPRNSCIAFEDREEVSCANYGVHMDNGHDTVPISVKIGFDYPHTVIGVGVIEGF